jgi:integrase
MNLQEHNNETEYGMKVWLSESEVDQLLEHAIHSRAKIAFALGVKCGLRSHEIISVQPSDIADSDVGPMLRIRGKGDKFRETPLPPDLQTTIETAIEFRHAPDSAPVVLNNNDEKTTTRTLRNWLATTREQLVDETDEPYWDELSFHDLRRTWATALASQDVDPLICCDWGGWSDLDTFLNHYRGTFSPDAQRRERDKVDWL